jgi:hypothetical protein
MQRSIRTVTLRIIPSRQTFCGCEHTSIAEKRERNFN